VLKSLANKITAFYRSLYLGNLFFAIGSGFVFTFFIGFFFSFIFNFAVIALLLFVLLVLADMVLLFAKRNAVYAKRSLTDKLSNGDENPVSITIETRYAFKTSLKIIDELPIQLQDRSSYFTLTLAPGASKIVNYSIRPTKRGQYSFGNINVYVQSPIRLISRRFTIDEAYNISVYPSFIQMRKYELLAISNRLTEAGIKKIRRIGNASEFDQIKDYVQGDDFRTVNWKATARRGRLMVNQYQDERSQQVYSIIDIGRIMKMPFEGLSLLDYSINTSLVISNIALYKQDKAGIITFSNRVSKILPAERRGGQLNKILELLYNQKTNYAETSFDVLYSNLRRFVNQRSLVLLYTNFESLSSLERQMPYLRRIADSHLLCVIFFENTELKELTEKHPKDTEEIYVKTIAEKFAYEKRLIVKELEKNGIHSILTAPQNLSVNTINKYLEFKSRGLI